MFAEACKKGVNTDEQAIVDDAFVLEGGDFVFALETGLVDLILLCADEGAFVDVGMDFDVGIVGELESVPFAVVDYHYERGVLLVKKRAEIAAAQVVRGVIYVRETGLKTECSSKLSRHICRMGIGKANGKIYMDLIVAGGFSRSPNACSCITPQRLSSMLFTCSPVEHLLKTILLYNPRY